MTMHTPGPWRRHDLENDAIVANHPDLTSGCEVANVGNSMFPENRRADTALIGAAPDLLIAADDLVKLIREVAPQYAESTVVANAVLAIAQARDE